MFNIEIMFRYIGRPDESAVFHGVYGLLGNWARSGQVLDTDCPVTFAKSACRVIVSCPETTSLSPRHANKYVRGDLSRLRSYGLLKPTFRLLGRGLESPTSDNCRKPGWYILITNYLSSESPLMCGDHYLPVPLYRVPPTYLADPSYWDVRCWQREWKCCDDLQMACGAGERFATKQISEFGSALSEKGREICRQIEKTTRVPTYYYLYRAVARSVASEQRRLCPSCGKQWLLVKPLHRIFDFKCDRCRIVSNIAWSARSTMTSQVPRKSAT